jgi:starvation-inducible outer membrane lipoprotein
MKTLALLATLALAALLAGCSTLPGGIDYSKMSPDAIKALSSDKSISANCTVANSVYGRVVTVSMLVDKGTVVNGGVAVDSECKVTVTNAPAPRPAAAPASAP